MKLKIFNLEIPLYGLCFFLGILLAAIVALLLAKRRKLDLFDFACAAIYAAIGGFIGAKLLFLLVSIPQIRELAARLSFKDTLLVLTKSGFVFYGGLLGGALGLFVYGKQFRTEISGYLDICATVLPLGHALGRVGCFFAGCCYGLEYHGWGAYVYKRPTDALTPVGVPLFPVQLVEAALLLVLFAVLLYLFLKKGRLGLTTAVYILSYSVLRFLLEFLRGDGERGGWLGLSTSQWVSLLLLYGACFVLFLRMKKRTK